MLGVGSNLIMIGVLIRKEETVPEERPSEEREKEDGRLPAKAGDLRRKPTL